MDKTLTPKSRIAGKVIVPGDKSISHRFLLLNAIADGTARGNNLLLGLDCLSTVTCLRSLGVEINISGNSATVAGVGMRGFAPPNEPLDVGNSGTTIRLLPGILVGQTFPSQLTGDESIKKRPMDRITKPLRMMKADITAEVEYKYAPIRIFPVANLSGIEYKTPIASAQVKSCLLLAGLYAEGRTVIIEPEKSRDHTERMLAAMGAECVSEGFRAAIDQTRSLRPLNMTVPGDISSAAYWLVAAIIMENTEIQLDNICLNPTRTGIIEALQAMGAKITIEADDNAGPEPVGTITAESSELNGTEICGALVPKIIDEIPILAIAASQAIGTTIIKDARELRVKEVDRIAAMVAGLSAIGVNITEREDGFIIHGPCRLKGGNINSFGDHRVAMSFAIASLIAQSNITITNTACAEISYPDFWQELETHTY